MNCLYPLVMLSTSLVIRRGNPRWLPALVSNHVWRFDWPWPPRNL